MRSSLIQDNEARWQMERKLKKMDIVVDLAHPIMKNFCFIYATFYSLKKGGH